MPLNARVSPANGNERDEALLALDEIRVHDGCRGRPRKRLARISGDKGYDSKEMRKSLRARGMQPEIPKRKLRGRKLSGRPLKRIVKRYVVERDFAWMQRKFRRVVVRWERLSTVFYGFIMLAIACMWVQRMGLMG